ncbi:hypothetical protein [Janibacter sp. GXQ6167]|uniref:hypothetical protein n=1 Tax=Janibacter sp. GXQ6167 TaxID=3240791 RepID=UPI003524E7B7
MPDGLLLILAINTAISVVASAVAGYAIAARAGRPGWQGALPGALVPWLSLVVLSLVWNQPGRAASPGNAARRIAAVLIALGALVILVSLTIDWFAVSGDVEGYLEGGTAAGVGDSGSGILTVAIVVAVFLAIAAAVWWHGGLRYSVPALFAVSIIGTLMLDTLITATFVSDAAGGVAVFSGGHASATLDVGLGAWLALVGLVFVYAGALLAVLRNRHSGPHAAAEPLPSVLQFSDGEPARAASRSPEPHQTSLDDW